MNVQLKSYDTFCLLSEKVASSCKEIYSKNRWELVEMLQN